MQYTPSQLREAVGLSKETFRYWKRILPVLSTCWGHAPSFSPGDLLASAIIRQLTETHGIRISHLTVVAPQVFNICNQVSWEVLANSILVLDLSENACLIVKKSHDIPIHNTVIVYPLRPLIAMLRNNLLQSSQSFAHTLVPPSAELGRSCSGQERL